MGPISWGYIDMAVLLLLLTLMNLHSFCCPFSSSYHVFPFSTFAVIRQQSLVKASSRGTSLALPLRQNLGITTTGEYFATIYKKVGSTMYKQKQEPIHLADETREKHRSIPPPSPPQQAFPASGDLHATLAISELEARDGTSRSIRLPDDRQTSVVVPAGAYEGQVISLEGLGEPAFPGVPTGTLTLTLTIIPAKETAPGPVLLRKKSTPQPFPRFFQSRALLLIGLLLLLVLGVAGSAK